MKITFTFFKQYVATYNNLIPPIKSEKAEVAKIIFYCCIYPVNIMYPSKSSWEQNLRIKLTEKLLYMFGYANSRLSIMKNIICLSFWITDAIITSRVELLAKSKGNFLKIKINPSKIKYLFNFSWNSFYVIFFLINDYKEKKSPFYFITDDLRA